MTYMNRKDIRFIFKIIIIILIMIGLTISSYYYFGNSINYFMENNLYTSIRNALLISKTLSPSMIGYIGLFNFYKYGLLYIVNLLFSNSLILVIISIIVSIILIYIFLNNKNINKESIFIYVLFLFINYIYLGIHNNIYDYLVLPFIIFSFISMDNRIKNNRIYGLSISIFMINLVNYTYLLPTIILLIIYGIYNYLGNNNKITFKKFYKYMISISIPIIVGILISSIVLIPIILYKVEDFIINYKFSFNTNIIVIFSIIYGIISDKKYRFISIILIILYILFSNYYICYILLEGLIICNFIDGVFKKNIDYRYIIICTILSIIYILFKSNIYSLELIIILLSVFLYIDYKNKRLVLIILSLYLISIGLYNNYKELYINKDLFSINKVMDINNEYVEEYNELFSLYRIITNNNLLGYATNDVMSYEDYEKFNSLQKEEILLDNIIADTKSHNNYVSNVKSIKIDQDRYYIKNVNNTKYTYELDTKNKIILIEFKCYKCDGNIKINNIYRELENNKIYRFTLMDNGIPNIYINLGIGEYDIRNVKLYSLDKANIDDYYLTLDKMNVIKNNSNVIEGDIRVSGDGYFMFTIPYESYYDLYLDGELTKYERVDGMYIGIPIKRGNHKIRLEKNNTVLLVSLFFSYIGLIFMWVINYLERKRKFV